MTNTQSTYTNSIIPICYNKNVTDVGSIGMIIIEETWMVIDEYEKKFDFIVDYKRTYCNDSIGNSLAHGSKCEGKWLYVDVPDGKAVNESSIQLTQENIVFTNEFNVKAQTDPTYRCPCSSNTDSEIVAQTATLVTNEYDARSSRTSGNEHMSVLCMRGAYDLSTACKIMRWQLYNVSATNTFNYEYEDLIYYSNSTTIDATNFQKIENKQHIGCLTLYINTPEYIASNNYIAAVNKSKTYITKLQSKTSYNNNCRCCSDSSCMRCCENYHIRDRTFKVQNIYRIANWVKLVCVFLI
jgi:hypothetical protein